MDSSVSEGAACGLEEFQLDVCASSRQLAGLVDAGCLPAPRAVLAAGVEPEICPVPARASLLRGVDAHGPYLMLSRLREAPVVMRGPHGLGPGQTCGAPEPGHDGPDSEAEILAGLCAGLPVGAVADLLTTPRAPDLRWLDLPGLRLIDLHRACRRETATYIRRRGRGQRVNLVALEAVCARQMSRLL